MSVIVNDLKVDKVRGEAVTDLRVYQRRGCY
jgi:hypothetical protein